MKIDTTAIEGYANMTAEEKVAAMEAYEIAEPKADDTEITKYKRMISDRNTEVADLKKQLRAKQTDEEAKAAKDAEEREAITKELEALRKREKISQFTTKYLELGYDHETAQKTATALADGDLDAVFASHKALTENLKKAAVVEAMNKQSGLSSGEPIGKEDAKKAETNKLRQAMGLKPIN